MRLEQIGFYTLTEKRAREASSQSPLSRCELILTGRCNFHCPYCRHVGGTDVGFEQAVNIIRLWAVDGLRCLRLTGGEPTLYQRLLDLVRIARSLPVERVAISTNGSAALSEYSALLEAGVDDFSISLDACCAEVGDKMAGGRPGAWEHVVKVIRYLASRTYVTVGIVLTEENVKSTPDIVRFAHDLGVADVRMIPAAQFDEGLPRMPDVPPNVLDAHPILKYRYSRWRDGSPFRGLCDSDSHRCGLVVDDMAAMGNEHYPCVIYLRERGKPIGMIGPGMRASRATWAREHDTHADPICRVQCLDVCVAYNNAYAAAH